MEIPFSLSGKRVMVAGHNGMVGSAISRRLKKENCDILSVDRSELDLTRQAEVEDWLSEHRPDVVFLAAAKVGGVLANNTYPADFLYDNLMIETSVIQAAHKTGVEKLLFLGSSCIYPRNCPQPMTEEALLSGSLEPTNEWYAIAKIAGIKLCQAYRNQYGSDFISAQPTNLYGVGDTYDLNGSHVIPALIMKAHYAKKNGAESIEIWGSGSPLREFLDADDLADALIFLMQNYSGDIQINVGSGIEISIGKLAQLICKVVGFKGRLTFDASKPDGAPRKLLDTHRLAEFGWQSITSLDEGLERAYRWYLDNKC